MPHPERSEKGDVVFSSMKKFIDDGNPTTDHTLTFNRPHYKVKPYQPSEGSVEWVIDMIITDNEAMSVCSALGGLEHGFSITRQTHWEISVDGDQSSALKKIDATWELYNSNKEFISKITTSEKTASFLVRPKEDVLGRAKFESLIKRFEIRELTKLKRGVIWNVTVNSGNFESILKEILNTHILFNPLSYECYRIN